MKTKLQFIAALVCCLVTIAAPAQTVSLLTTLTNPAPESMDFFGISVAGVGADKVLVGAHYDNTGATDAGAAYLFDLNGTLLTTFTNPSPALGDLFGNSLAAVGADKVLIGAYTDDTGATDAGAAYLFDLNGTLLTTFTSPTPASSNQFGVSVAAVGTDKVLIGANSDNTGATDAGAAFLFDLNGTLLTTFTNPAPAPGDFFGNWVAGVGTDKVLIGAYFDDTGATDAGAAYLFDLSGTLLTTFTNPTPALTDNFGVSVAAVGSDKILIGAYSDDTGAFNAGAAYLFDLNGTRLTTFTNPTPASADLFGFPVAAVGTDRVLIGACLDNTGATDAGAAYLFDLNGTLLATITNPAPLLRDQFGAAVAAVGSDKIVIGAWQDNLGSDDDGAAYLYTLPTTGAPRLTVNLTATNSVLVSWPLASTGFNLQQNTNLSTTNWVTPTETITNNSADRFILVNPPTGNRFYRLFKP